MFWSNFNTGRTIFRVSSLRNSSSLVIVEHDNSSYLSSLKNVLTAAKQLNNEIKCVVCGNNKVDIANQVSTAYPFKSCIYIESNKLHRRIPEYYADAITQYIQQDTDITHVLTASTIFSKNLIPRIAANFLSSPISEVSKILSADSFQRAIYAGNVLVNVKSNDKLKFMTILSTSFEPIKEQISKSEVKEISYIVKCKANTEWLEDQLIQSDLPDLATAKVVVSGGRGLKTKENFKLIFDLAKKLNAGIGATRAAVDAEYILYDHQVGQSGKIVAPQLYIAVGISGAIQHVAGMKDSKIIVAINKDADAPIFQIADYGLVADALTVLPEMIRKIK